MNGVNIPIDIRKVFNTAAILSYDVSGIAPGTTLSDIIMQNEDYNKKMPPIKISNWVNSTIESRDFEDIILNDTDLFESQVEKEAYNLFGNLRELTPEERIAQKDTLKNISKETGVNIFDL